MRILFLSRSLDGGGAERQLLVIAAGLAAAGHDCAIATFYGHETMRGGVRVIPLRKRGRWDVLGFAVRLARQLRRERPDAIYAFLPVANVLAIALRRLVPRSAVVLGVRSSDMDQRRYDWLSGFSYRLEAALARFADAVIANAEAGRRAATARGIPSQLIAVVPNGIDTGVFARDAAAGREFRTELGFTDDDIVIGMVARFDPMKDHETFLEAFRAAAAAVPNLHAVLVGDGPEPVRARAASLGNRVRFAGWRSDMPAVYSALDIFCLSSAFGEGAPNVVVEAMACEVPSVVTDVGDSAALVGGFGRVAPPRDSAALAGALIEFARMPPAERRTLGRGARQRIDSLLSMESLLSETGRVLAAAVQRRRSLSRRQVPR